MTTRNSGAIIRLSVAALMAVVLACAPAGQPGDENSGQSIPLPFTGASGGLTAAPVAAQALSQHYVELTFDRPVGSEAEKATLYTIAGPDGGVLAVTEVRRLGDDATRVLLVTDKQQEGQYQLTVQRAERAAKIIRLQAPPGNTVLFAGSTTIEPFVSSAIALTNTSVLVTYGGAMDNNVLVSAYYEILNPNLTIGSNIELYNAATRSAVVLTTSPQESIDYTIRITNVTTANGTKLIDPTRNRVTFHGIDANAPLYVTGAAATSASTVLVSFNKPLADDVADATHFVITPTSPTASAPKLVVTTAEMVRYNTQIKLTTLPMNAGWTYRVRVIGNVRDRERLEVITDPSALLPPNDAGAASPATDDNAAIFRYAGLPCVVSAVSLSPKEVLVTFDTALGYSSLVPANYSIADPDLDLSKTTSPRWVDFSRRTAVILTTTQDQEDIDYTVRVSSVMDATGTNYVDPLHNTATFNGTSPEEPALYVTGACAASSTSVLVSFSRMLADDAAETTHFKIEPLQPDADAPDLVLTAADMSSNNTQVRLTTTPMIAGWQYRVTVTGVRDREARNLAAVSSGDFWFIAAPALMSATALSNTEVLVVYNATMGDSAVNPDNYAISDPYLAICTSQSDPPAPPVFVDAWRTMVKLTTSSQENIDYALRASVAITGGGDEEYGIPLDPGQSTAQFNGIGSAESLTLDTVVATGATTVLASFSRPLTDNSADPTYFKVESIPPEGYEAANLTITGAVLTPNGTQVKLTTAPMTAGWSYKLSVQGVRDRDRRVRMTPAQTRDFTYVVSPGVVDAIALNMNEVLVIFDAAMDSNAADATHYWIFNPSLQVTAAQFVPNSQNTAIKLTTSTQQSLYYTLRVVYEAPSAFAPYTTGDRTPGGITSGGIKPLDPGRSTATFSGIAPDLTLQVTGAVATSATSVLVSFNMPLADDAADPTKFTIPGVVVTSAMMSLYNTQVKLTMLPLIAGLEYTVTVEKVRDRELSQVIDWSQTSTVNKASFMYLGPPDQDFLPRVLGAISLDNTHVLVSFNKPMGPSALVGTNYMIVQEFVNTEVGTLFVDPDAEWWPILDASHTSVRLTTSSQNEVTYRVRAVNVKDISGNGLAPQGLLVDPTSATFAGTPPSGGDDGSAGDFIDKDLDGLTDNQELRGYVVTIQGSDGETYEVQVTSNPFVADTDGDGLDDLVERAIRTDPRNPDTDSDGLRFCASTDKDGHCTKRYSSDYAEFNVYYTSPTSQDTDEDGLDDNLEVTFFKTSPLFDDTDGDGLQDGDEINAGNRNPLISDLPEPGILIGEVALRLDTRFQYTDTEGNSQKLAKSNQATLQQSQEKTFTQTDTETTKHEVEAGGELGYSSKDGVSAKLTAKYTFARENTFTASAESKAGTQREYQNSLSTEVSRDVTKEVQRTVEGASIDLVVTLGNFSDIPFTMSNLEVTALMQDPYNRRRLSPVASLLPASMLTTGDFEVYLGPFIQERGPFIFKSTDVFPSMVEDLMKNPRGLIFKVANFDITDEQGRNFAYISQDVNDRTAGLIIDYGNGEVEKYRIATSSTFDENTGKPKGITMAYALQAILGMAENLPQNAITVGSNGCAETFASGDDIQVVMPVCLPVAPGGVIVRPGPNGILDTVPVGDDWRTVVNGTLVIVDGGDGCAHTRAQRDDVQVVAAECVTGGLDGVVVMDGGNGIIETVPGGDDELTAISGYGTALIGQCDGVTTNTGQIIEPYLDGNGVANTTANNDGIDTNSVLDDVQLVPKGAAVIPGTPIVGPGPNGILETMPLGDEVRQGPGCLCATNDNCPGGTCRPIQRLVRVKGIQDKPAEARFWVVIGPPDMKRGSNFNELVLKAGNVYTLAYVQDQDMDGLYAREEYLNGSSDRRVNSDGCPLGDGADGCDTNVYDFDTVRDFEEVRTGWQVFVAGQSGYTTYVDPVQPDTDADRLFDDEERAMGTDGAKRDTDDDGISDFDEVRGYQILRRDGVVIRNVVPYQSAIVAPGRDSGLQTEVLRECTDTITQYCDVSGVDAQNRPIITSGPDGVIDSMVSKDDVLEGTGIILDGGNGEPETLASGDDIQVGPKPVPTRTVTVTFLDFQPGSSSGDAEGPGEFVFNLFARQGDEDTRDTTVSGLVSAYETHTFGATATFIFENVAATGTITFGADILEDDPTCSPKTRSVIIEPLTTGNRLADTLAATIHHAGQTIPLDYQEKAFAGPVAPGQIVISSCQPVHPFDPLGLLNSSPGLPGLCKPYITAGPDGIANTLAAGDDEQLVFQGTAGANVIGPGPNGLIDTTPAGDDVLPLPYGPVAPYPCEPYIAEPLTGGDGVVLTVKHANDDWAAGVVFGGTVTPGQVLIRPGSDGVLDTVPQSDVYVIIAGSDADKDTTAVAEGSDDVLVDLGTTTVEANTVLVRPGPDGILQTVPAAGDTLAIAEPMEGGDGYVNTKAATTDTQVVAPPTMSGEELSGGVVTPGQVIVVPGADGTLETQVPADILVPAKVPADGLASSCPSGAMLATTQCDACPSGECYGDDVLVLRVPGDSCEQAWLTDDPLACPCGTCLKYNTDPPSTFERWTPDGVTLVVRDIPALGVIVALSNGPGSFGAAVLRVKVEVTPGAAVLPGAVVVRAGPNGKLDTVPSGDDVLGVPHLTLYASNPLDRDTDADTLFDGAERILGSNPNDARDAQRYRDNDLDGLPNGVEVDGWVLAYVDAAGTLQCLTNSGTMTVEDEYDPPAACLRVTSDPFEPDTDFDGLPDLLEKLVHSDPRGPDTDGDGLLDYDEFDPKSRFSIPTLVIREFQRLCAEAPRCVYTPAESPHGTSVVLADTDHDGLTDRQEVEEFWIIAPCSADSGYAPGLPKQVFSSPLTADFDLDNLLDGQEKALLLDPLNPDTDGDGKPDQSDGTPDGCGKSVTITFLSYTVDNNCQATGKGDFKFRFTIETPRGDILHFDQDFSLSDNGTHTFPSSFTTTFTMRAGDTFAIDGQMKEPDSASADEVWTLNERVYDYSVATGEVIIGPVTGESYASCYGNHKLTLQFTVGQD